MDIQSVLTLVLTVGALVLVGVAVWTLVEVRKAAGDMRQTSARLEQRIGPVIDKAEAALEKADVTLDLFNAEVLRIDSIVSQVEDVSERVTETSEAVTGVVRAPAAFVAGFTSRLRESRAQRRQHEAESHDADEERTNGTGSDHADGSG